MFYANPILNHDSGELRVLEFFNFEIDLHQYIYTIGAVLHKNIKKWHLNTDKHPNANAMSGGQTVFKCQYNNAKIKSFREYSCGWRVSAVWCRLQSSATMSGFVSSPWSPVGASYSLATRCTTGSNISKAFLVLVVSTSCHFVLVYLHLFNIHILLDIRGC